MGRNANKTCEVCLKSFRGDHLTRHMKKHEKEHTVDLDNKSAKCEMCMKTMRKNHLKRHMKKHEKKISKNSGVMLYDDVTIEMQDFNRKKEMGRKLKVIMENNANINENAFSKEKKEALEIFNLYGKSSQLLKTNWRG